MHPYTLFVDKTKYVRSFKPGFVTVMWTFSDSTNMTEPNHFVLLVPYHAYIHLTVPTTSSPSTTPDLDSDIAYQEPATQAKAPLAPEVMIRKTRHKCKHQATASTSPRSEPCSRKSIQVIRPTIVLNPSITLPSAWKDGILVALYKGKGTKTECCNYRPITLLSVPGKVFAHVLLARTQPLLDMTRRPEQSGFVAGRSTMDAILALRLLRICIRNLTAR